MNPFSLSVPALYMMATLQTSDSCVVTGNVPVIAKNNPVMLYNVYPTNRSTEVALFFSQ